MWDFFQNVSYMIHGAVKSFKTQYLIGLEVETFHSNTSSHPQTMVLEFLLPLQVLLKFVQVLVWFCLNLQDLLLQFQLMVR